MKTMLCNRKHNSIKSVIKAVCTTLFVALLVGILISTSTKVFAQTEWTKYEGNPVLNIGSAGEWDDAGVFSPSVLTNGYTYQMWYSGLDGIKSRTGYATSTDGVNWTKDTLNPVLDVGSPGSWDDEEVLLASVLFDGSIYHMWYSGFDGIKLRIGYATSTDGVNWTKDTLNPVLDVGSPGTWDDEDVVGCYVLFDGTIFHMWYSGNDGSFYRIGYATSPNGVSWTKDTLNPILDVGDAWGWDRLRVQHPRVVTDGTTYHMWYSGGVNFDSRIGHATSPDGVSWTKDTHINYVLNWGNIGSWDDDGVATPFVVFDSSISSYKMWYTGDDGSDIVRIGYATSLFTQELTLEQIKTNLLNNPPNTGDPTVREETILALDEILKYYSFSVSQSVNNFYTFMMENVNMELQDTLSAGASIWMMYNHGFVVKTPQNVFAFDLVDGYSGWSTYLPSELIQQIEVLFVSHNHGDHYDYSVANTVIANGGYVVIPSENSNLGNVPMAAGDSLTILGLHIKAHYGLHSSVPLRIYEVTTYNGLKILHTGDNQTSETLPDVDSLDVLLLNAWVNESGSATAVVGMRNSINKLDPTVMIPGHIQELSHDYIPGNPTSRVPYEWAFEVDDEPLNSEVQVMAWGERYFVSGELVEIVKHNETPSFPKSFALHQNHPNPFNPVTTLHYDLPERAEVTLMIYDILGRHVRTLVHSVEEPGKKSVVWDGTNELGEQVSSGVYLYRIKADGFTQNRKMVLLK